MRFHHLLCSYTSLGRHTRQSPADCCNNIGTCIPADECDIAEFDASYSYCLPTAESNGSCAVLCEETGTVCHVNAAADDLLHVASSYITSVCSSSQQHSCYTSANNADGRESTDLHLGTVGFKARLRVNVETLSELELWQKDFAERSKTTMRFANVSVCTGKKTLYKVRIVFVLCM